MPGLAVGRLAGLVLLVSMAGLLVGWRAPSAGASTLHTTVSIGAPLQPVPRSFLGLSVELNELPDYERWTASFVRLLSVLRPPGVHVPLILRAGGESADSSVWGPDQAALVAPPYRQRHAYELTTAWMKGLGALIRTAGVKLILDLNLAAHSPKMAAEEVASARQNLPAGSVSAFEIGNEPDIYSGGYVGDTRQEPGDPNDWGFDFTTSDYTSLFAAYVRAITRVFPGATFAGPSGANRSPVWTNALLASPAGDAVSSVTVHAYPPLRACFPPTSPQYPTVGVYLKDWVAEGVVQSLRYVLAASRIAGRPLRLTEVGSATCGGVAGGTDTFATALWAPDLLFALASAGFAGVNIHLRAKYPNSALEYTSAGIQPEPLFYGMALFARVLGPHAKLMQVTQTGGPERLKVWAVRLRDGSLNVLFDNKSSHHTSVELSTPLSHRALLERLTAPSIRANSTVTLAGQQLGMDGRWHGKLAARHVRSRAHVYRVLMSAFTAAVLSIPAG